MLSEKPLQLVCTGCECRCPAAPVGFNPPCFVPDFGAYFKPKEPVRKLPNK